MPATSLAHWHFGSIAFTDLRRAHALQHLMGLLRAADLREDAVPGATTFDAESSSSVMTSVSSRKTVGKNVARFLHQHHQQFVCSAV